MWLINTSSLQLAFFPDERGLAYAILSHRWQEEEVTFADMQRDGQVARRKAGWTKLRRTCAQAKRDGAAWVWMDTCCIDKSSSAELSEAINSMYRWYQRSTACYAYLFDVDGSVEGADPHALARSAWFTRGWTLQELIAPAHVRFYNADWTMIGTRDALWPLITHVTGIPKELLVGEKLIEEYSVAQRMSWAANRETTRVEDMAYSLMGLFNVHMPMLYGEGEAAFIRLQEEIIKHSADETIFAWRCEDTTVFHGLLAPSPTAFSGCQNLVCAEKPFQRTYFQSTNIGISIKLRAYAYDMNVFHAALDCESIQPHGRRDRIGIFLGHPGLNANGPRVARQVCRGHSRLTFTSTSARYIDAIIHQRPFMGQRVPTHHYGFQIRAFSLGDMLTLGRGVHVIARANTWNPQTSTVTLHPGTRGTALCFAVRGKQTHKVHVVARLGFDQDFAPLLFYGGSRWAVGVKRPKLDPSFGYAMPAIADPSATVTVHVSANEKWDGAVGDILDVVLSDEKKDVTWSNPDGEPSFCPTRGPGNTWATRQLSTDEGNMRSRPDIVIEPTPCDGGGIKWVVDVKIPLSM